MSYQSLAESVDIRPDRSRGGFTLVELLVVIGIIIVLVGLTIGVGSSVANSGRQRATEGALQALDQILDTYIQSAGANPPAFVRVPEASLPASSLVSGGRDGYFPLFDGYSDDDQAPVNTVGLFLLEAKSVPATQGIVAGLDPKFVRLYQAREAADALQPELLTVFDAWGNPFRMVHPRFDGVILNSARATGDAGDPIDLGAANTSYLQGSETVYAGNGQIGLERLRRNALKEADFQADRELVGDSDGGVCPSPRPYFYSAGPDGDPSTLDDNVYSTRPRFES